MKLKNHPNMSCDIVDVGNKILSCISYYTEVCRAFPSTDEKDVYILEPRGQYWDGERVYTPTTARHISYFLREYFPNCSYQAFKYAAIKGIQIRVPMEV